MLASELIARALRLINVPGRGSTLSGADQADALDALQDLLASEAVSRVFVPGIRRHFFTLNSNQAIYSYGPAGELDTDLFSDPAPVRIEDGYIRSGAVITDNERVTSPELLTATGWTLGTGWTVANGKATIAAGNAGETLSQPLALVAGTTYTVIVQVTHRAGSVTLEVNQDGSPILSQVLAGSATYTFETTFAGTTADVTITAASTSDLDIERVSIIETGLDRYSLPDGQGSDYPMRQVDQKRYNDIFAKGVGGRPSSYLYSRGYGLGELRFDYRPLQGDVVVMDVLVDRVSVTSASSIVRVHPDAIRWIKYALANEVAGSYGKALTRSQERIMAEAWHLLTAGNRRKNLLRVDGGLLARGTDFNINRGDP